MSDLVVGALRAPHVSWAPPHPRLRCASLLKPLVFWAAAPSYRARPQEWRALAEPAIVVSQNEPTTRVWNECGAGPLLDRLAELVGGRWPLEPGGVRPFGRVLVTAGEVAEAYAALMRRSGDDPAAATVLELMRAVPDELAFGVRPVVTARLAVPSAEVAVKAGWFCDGDEVALRSHVVTVTGTPDGPVATAVLSQLGVPVAVREQYARDYAGGLETLAAHESVAGDRVRAATAAALAHVED